MPTESGLELRRTREGKPSKASFPLWCLFPKTAWRLPCHHLTSPLRLCALVGAEVAGLGVHVAPARLALVLVQVKDVDADGRYTCPSCSSSQKAGHAGKAQADGEQ